MTNTHTSNLHPTKGLCTPIKDAENILASAQKQRASEVDRSIDLGEAFLGERTTLFESIEELNNDRDLIIAEAAKTKKRHSALKMKVKVLQEEDEAHEGPEIHEARNELAALRNFFAADKSRLDLIDTQLDQQKDQLNRIQEKIDLASGPMNGASEVFSLISQANRDITKAPSRFGPYSRRTSHSIP